ncbi:tRNA1(Val) (adenine(37)-N6)-methyltransferase [Cecembia lonarensis]|uniref:tRNA1(Val) (adenine(37)-N6)-methyltransferase n=1 Tax=Cecembia lonarensis (strain CCUG 58316 / KCTC 22772 / LW9) TaxID=1225176 RepID=K1L5G5_CECL9|nr:methyltransferase [Cecembia lonarensis]EKB50031.1 tRNA1(Val) (adenine(37)-N6)-methyltransferase [Cecembia lonarensis LW9]
MSKSFFQFKQFGIHQDHCAMKVGTDGVLLGALSRADNATQMLEIGVGTGVVSLMMAQRYPNLDITGVEIDQETWSQASQNAENSPWADRICFINEDFKLFSKTSIRKFDLVVSNPPYFKGSLLSIDPKRNLALHQSSLNFEALLDGTIEILADDGEVFVILPPVEMAQFKHLAMQKGLFQKKEFLIRDKASKPLLRKMGNFSRQEGGFESQDLIIKDENGKFSDTYAALLKDFLLIF